jgi:hypothetical protein
MVCEINFLCTIFFITFAQPVKEILMEDFGGNLKSHY